MQRGNAGWMGSFTAHSEGNSGSGSPLPRAAAIIAPPLSLPTTDTHRRIWAIDVLGVTHVCASVRLAPCRGLDRRAGSGHRADQLRRRIALAHDGKIRAIAFCTDGKLMATASHDWTIKIWDAA